MIARISWPHDIDDTFRARYLAVTGESIQEHLGKYGDEYRVGSSRCTRDHANALLAEFETLNIEFEVLE